MTRLTVGLCVSGLLHGVVLLGLSEPSLRAPRFDVRSGASSVEMVFAAPSRPAPAPTKNDADQAPSPAKPSDEEAASRDDREPSATESPSDPPERSSKPEADTATEPDSPSTPEASEPSSSDRESASSSPPRAARDAGVRWVQDVAYRQNPPPRYPTKARVYGEEGTVRLLVTINPDGHPLRVTVHESSGHPRLDRAARKAVRRWEFVPARKEGEPVRSQTLVPVSFELDR